MWQMQSIVEVQAPSGLLHSSGSLPQYRSVWFQWTLQTEIGVLQLQSSSAAHTDSTSVLCQASEKRKYRGLHAE